MSSSTRSIGYSPLAGRVLTDIAYRDDGGDLHLINAWPATPAVLKIYREEREPQPSRGLLRAAVR